ncbi:MAG TPA: peptidylprolyl isomerase [Phycisphaerales bacterium]|nr:peptidylprolyl isomerase [Phycisphaerales bacterium]
MRTSMKALMVLGVVGGMAMAAFAQTTPASEPKTEPAKVEPAKTEPVPVKAEAAKLEYVMLSTTQGDIVLELNAEKAPITVANFLSYVDKGFYNGTVFHRVISNFMIQGGGFDGDMKQKPTEAAIKNESKNGLKNSRGTIAMARLSAPDSATAQFFINVVDNPNLDPGPSTGAGYAVFGKVIAGMEAVDKIRYLPTGVKARMPDVPNELPVITTAKRLTKDEADSKVNAGKESKPAETKPAEKKPEEKKSE